LTSEIAKKTFGFRGSTPDPTGGSYSALTKHRLVILLSAGGEGLTAPSQEPLPTSALWASDFSPSGLVGPSLTHF